MSFGSNESRSMLSSLKGLPISVKTWNNVSTLSRKTGALLVSVRDGSYVQQSIWLRRLSYWAKNWLTSGPAIIHLISAEGSSVTPMISPLAWSFA